MPNLKDQLIRLGSDQPKLQEHLRPIIDQLPLEREAKVFQAPPPFSRELSFFLPDKVRRSYPRTG